ncbi:MAG: acyl carrier protein [Desulfobacterales bacterium]|nr:acyl carrier protein [Desulfobacterales bacterium]
MTRPDKATIFKDIVATLERVGEDWEYSGQITLDTTLLQDLGLESIDVVVLGEFLEEHYGQTFPFTEYYTELSQKNKSDIRIADLVDLIFDHFVSA